MRKATGDAVDDDRANPRSAVGGAMNEIAAYKSVDFKNFEVRPGKAPILASASRSGTIGIIDPCYGSSHVIYGLDTKRYKHSTLTTIPLNRLDRRGTFFKFSPIIVNRSVKLVHSWNSIPVNKDFIVSFELELPRYLSGPSRRRMDFGFKMLKSTRCKSILALSEFAYRSARRTMVAFGYPDLVEKMTVFRGAVRDPLEMPDLAARPSPSDFTSEPLKAILIGTELFRKGGMFAIKAFERLRQAGLNVELTLVGDFESTSYAFGEHIPDAEEWRARARSHNWIRFTAPLRNRAVFDELRKHHICLYPSLDESLGWLPIEAQMAEVPVILNKICAFPELVLHDQSGWLIDLPVSSTERWEGIGARSSEKSTMLARADLLIQDGIIESVSRLYRDPGLILEWGTAGRKHALSLYGVSAASRRLEKIYDEALSPG